MLILAKNIPVQYLFDLSSAVEYQLCCMPMDLWGSIKGVVLTSKDLEGSSEEEASTLLQSEELAEEEKERQAAEDDGQDHECLDRLNPLCKKRREKEIVFNKWPSLARK